MKVSHRCDFSRGLICFQSVFEMDGKKNCIDYEGDLVTQQVFPALTSWLIKRANH